MRQLLQVCHLLVVPIQHVLEDMKSHLAPVVLALEQSSGDLRQRTLFSLCEECGDNGPLRSVSCLCILSESCEVRDEKVLKGVQAKKAGVELHLDRLDLP